MKIREGDLVSFVGRDGVMYTERYQTPAPPVYPRLAWWQRTLRALTPRPWRKPLKPTAPLSPIERHQKLIGGMLTTVEKLTQPPVPWWRRWLGLR